MRRFVIRSIVMLVSTFCSIAAFAQSRDEQVAYCMSSDQNALVQIISGCTALITSGQESAANLAVELNNRGNAYDDQNDYAHAIADYNQAIRINPQDATAFFNRGLSLSHRNDYTNAIDDYSEAIRLNPQYAKAYLGRGRAKRVLGKNTEGNADVAHACALDPANC